MLQGAMIVAASSRLKGHPADIAFNHLAVHNTPRANQLDLKWL
tara:strand:- start:186 stop:314 length:129 start_codon:yes stop_codon:yes gene_type:complete